jgi:hypothetical protein
MRNERVWRFIASGAVSPGTVSWFCRRYSDAAARIVERWGPRWSRRKVFRCRLGVWILFVAWAVGPTYIAISIARRFLHLL